MDLREGEGVDPHRHWYSRAKAQAVVDALMRHGPSDGVLLDVGAESGFFAEHLLREGLVSRAVCVDTAYEAEGSPRGTEWIQFVNELPDGRFDVVLLIDVLEHVADDVELFEEALSRLRVGGAFVVTVPAFQALWSGHDVFLEHHRRYRLPELRKVVERPEVDIRARRYLFGGLFPVALLLRRTLRRRDAPPTSDMKNVPHWLDAVLTAWFGLEHRLLPQRLFGLSAMVVGLRAR